MAVLNIMIGIPGSGKTTWARKNIKTLNAELISSDEIRKKMFGFESQDHNNEVFEEMKKETLELLDLDFNVIYDATNLSSKYRKALINEVKNKIFCVEINAYLMCTPIDKILERNLTRVERKLPWDKLELLIKSIEPPMYYEGFDNIYLINGGIENDEYDFDTLFKKSIGYNQNSPHHSETLDTHILNVIQNVNSDNLEVKIAAKYHDFGKLYTKVLNKKGRFSYYGHEYVSTYLYLCHIYKSSIIDNLKRVRLGNLAYRTSALILNHMEYYKRSDMSPIKDNLGEDLFALLEILHKADEKGSIKEEENGI